MSEDQKVVRPIFGSKRPGSQSLTPTPQTTVPRVVEMLDETPDVAQMTDEQRQRAQADLLYMLANREFLQRMRDKLDTAGDVIFSLGNFVVDQESIRVRRKGLQGLTLQELCQAIDITNELQWRAQPSYIGALTLEHHARLQAAKAVIPKRGD